MAADFSSIHRDGKRGKSRNRSTRFASGNAKAQAFSGKDDLMLKAVEDLRRGDDTAAQCLYEACWQDVFRVAAHMVGSQDAPDVTQQVFLKAFSSLRQFDGKSCFQTWLYRIAVNEALQHRRRNRRWHFHPLDWEPAIERQTSTAEERQELLHHALQRIDPELRSIILLREVEGLSYCDIAKSIGISQGTVGSRLNRARRELFDTPVEHPARNQVT